MIKVGKDPSQQLERGCFGGLVWHKRSIGPRDSSTRRIPVPKALDLCLGPPQASVITLMRVNGLTSGQSPEPQVFIRRTAERGCAGHVCTRPFTVWGGEKGAGQGLRTGSSSAPCSSMNPKEPSDSKFDQMVKKVYLTRQDDRMYLFNSWQLCL